MTTIQDQEAPTVWLSQVATDMTVRTITQISDEFGTPISGDAIAKYAPARVKVRKPGLLWKLEEDRNIGSRPQQTFAEFMAMFK